ncbi:MAG TPA: DUF6629 family protein [Urbifossiella sp.]|nr:DUF6629 family protein [Urbifossiella sp.]
MCFSTEMSVATGVVLLPAGAYCVSAALRKNRHYLLVAATPAFFGIQQLCEAGVWIGFDNRDARLVRESTIAYLFFAIAFWPGWVPFGAAILERRPGKRALCFILSGIGLAMGCLCYFPAVFHYGEWLNVYIMGHSIRYDFSGLPFVHSILSIVWQVLYLGIVSVPLLISRDHALRALGITIALAALAAQLMFRYAFISVWCFFAAVVSLHIAYIVYRLPDPHPHPVAPEMQFQPV